LVELTGLAASASPFAFFSHILQKPCPADISGGMRAMRTRLGPDAADSLDELLNAALEFEKSNIPSLQLFLQWQTEQLGEIKREMDRRQEVRIMTVHGAKGLQAPIVILPDS